MKPLCLLILALFVLATMPHAGTCEGIIELIVALLFAGMIFGAPK